MDDIPRSPAVKNSEPDSQDVRVNCPTCCDIRLMPSEITVRVCASNGEGSYNFRCFLCDQCCAKEASRNLVDLLVSYGCRMQVWRLPVELEEKHVGPPLTLDDLLDFHLLLESYVEEVVDPWFAKLAAEVRRSSNRPIAT